MANFASFYASMVLYLCIIMAFHSGETKTQARRLTIILLAVLWPLDLVVCLVILIAVFFEKRRRAAADMEKPEAANGN